MAIPIYKVQPSFLMFSWWDTQPAFYRLYICERYDGGRCRWFCNNILGLKWTWNTLVLDVTCALHSLFYWSLLPCRQWVTHGSKLFDYLPSLYPPAYYSQHEYTARVWYLVCQSVCLLLYISFLGYPFIISCTQQRQRRSVVFWDNCIWQLWH